MRNLSISFFLILCSYCLSCPINHIYDDDVIELIDFEEDRSSEILYSKDHEAQWPYGFSQPDSKKILQQASYAFETFRYSKCLEKIKEYEKVAFPPPYDLPSSREKLIIIAYKAYANRFLKNYDSAIRYFDEMIRIIEEKGHLSPECKFITYFEQAQCYLLKGNKKEFHSRIKKIIDSDIAPKYEYYVKNDFKIHHQPCFHHHDLKDDERMIFKEIAPVVLGKELYALLEQKGETPRVCGVDENDKNSDSCRRLCARASYLSALIVGCLTRKKEAMAAAAALGELLVDCDVCCRDGWGSENCCRDLKWAFKQVCQQHMLDGL